MGASMAKSLARYYPFTHSMPDNRSGVVESTHDRLGYNTRSPQGISMPNDHSNRPLPMLFSPLKLRGMTLKNRVVISPMCQYSAVNGVANDWHLVHLGQFAKGGAALIFCEAAAVEERGRITHGDLGIWNDAQIAPLERITDFIKGNGCVPAIQLAHAGRKASMQRPWFGNAALNVADIERGDLAWNIVGPSQEPVAPGWLLPHELSVAEIKEIVQQWKAATRRSLAAGFDVLEVHGAHGYLLHSFLSPLANHRTDSYGGSFENRIRLTLEIVDVVRKEWPDDKPLFFRASASDYAAEGWQIADTVALARDLKKLGVDVIDCSSGGIAGSATAAPIKRYPGFQVQYAEQVKKEAGILTQAVGIILSGTQAEEILQSGRADLIAVGREALFDPHWAVHAARELGADAAFELWPKQYGWWLNVRAKMLQTAT
jgi:2,4-dienoyl-CoA reductase-like NADH-dependent reductase (Old Yellow Enzyme family)